MNNSAYKFILFKTEEKKFCLKTKDIKAISKIKKITPINHPNPNIIGVTIIHEEIYSCIDLGVSVPDLKNYIITLNIENVNIGIICSKIEGFSQEIKPSYYLISAPELALNDFRFKVLVNHKCFHFNNIGKACNLAQLLEKLIEVDQKDFSHHVNQHKNDFVKWIKDVLNFPKIAKRIEKAKTKEEMLKILSNEV